MNYIDFVVRNKHIESRQNAIIADNTDYMMRFAFDEGWADYPDKTVLVLDNEGKIWELHLTGGATEVTLPKLIGRKLLAVGVTATAGGGEISTDAVSLRVNPSIRTGASEVIESPESGAKDMLEEYRQKYDALIAELQAAIDSTYLGVTGAEVGQTVRITEVDEDGNPVAWEAVDFPEQIQTDYEQTDETAADYLKNRPFGNVAYDGIFFKRVPGGYNLVRVPGFNDLANIQGSRKAEIRRGGNVVNTGSANVSVSDYDGSISIKYTSAQTIISFSGSYGTLNMIYVQWNGGISNEGEYVLHIDGLYYKEYIKLSADKVEGTLPYASTSDYIPVSAGSGYSNYRAKALSSVIPILGVSGASVGQIVKIKSVDSSGKPTAWEAVELPIGAYTVNLTMGDDGSITADKTFAEIKAAYDEGKVVNAKFADAIVPLQLLVDSEAAFKLTNANSSGVYTASLICTSANVWSMSQDGFDASTTLGLTGATVGQTVKIKVVDENGVPTEWEPADMPSGSGGGTDTSLGVTGAEVGQIVKIKAVDENGVPTEWEASDVKPLKLVGEYTLSENALRFDVENLDISANAISIILGEITSNPGPALTVYLNGVKWANFGGSMGKDTKIWLWKQDDTWHLKALMSNGAIHNGNFATGSVVSPITSIGITTHYAEGNSNEDITQGYYFSSGAKMRIYEGVMPNVGY